MIKHEIARLSGVRIYYETTGQGPPLILLHGLSGSAKCWGRNITALASVFTVYALDWVGFGHSRGQRFQLAAAPALLHDWVAHLGLERFHLVGHSMGGYIAAALAANSPHLVDRLVLVDAAVLPSGRSFTRATLSLLQAARYLTVDFLPILLGDSLRAGPFTLVRASRDILKADLSADLERITAPTLIIWGENDPILTLSLGRRLHAALPASRLVILPRASHNSMWDQPLLFNQTLLDFLQPESSPDADR